MFGTLGLVNRLAMFSITGGRVLGSSADGLPSVISLVVGAGPVVAVVAAARGGRTASTVTVAVGAAFLLSGVANVLVVGTPSDVRGSTSPARVTGLAAAREMRRSEDRVATWRTATDDGRV